MDQSFDQFGGGWGDQNDQESAHVQKANFGDKIPIPVDIEDLLKMPSDEEKFAIGQYSFIMVRLMGKVVSVNIDSSHSITYEICDALAQDNRTARRLTAFRHPGVDDHVSSVIKDEEYLENQTVQIVGKLRPFNNRMGILVMDIHGVSMEEIEVYKMECALAKLYYEKNVPEYPSDQLENTIFQISGRAPKMQQPTRPGTAASTIQQGAGGYSNTPSRASNVQTPTTGRQQPQQPLAQQQQQGSYLTKQQQEIVNFVMRYSNHGTGVHVEQIRVAVKADDRFESDLQFLQNEGKIYTSIDDEHYATVE